MSRIKFPAIKSSAVAAAILLFTSNIAPADAHTWVEQVRRIATNGTFVGDPGYSRGMIARGPGFSDPQQVYMLPPDGRGAEGILPTDKIARFGEESYTAEFPKLAAAPGEIIALRYQENGHVSIPDSPPNKPANRGNVFIYATDQPSDDDKFLDIHHKWNTDGTGGDKRGKLIATRNFDDGQCRQVNGGEISQSRNQKFQKAPDTLQGGDLWCQVDVLIPEDVAVDSVYTMFWVWDWPTLSPELAQKSKNGDYPTQGEGVETPQVYTSAIDINIVAADDTDLAGPASFAQQNKASIDASFIGGEGVDVGNMAIKEQLSNMFIIPPPNVDAPPFNDDDENTEVPSVGTEAPASSAPASSAPAS
ncbi:hypothetical protein IMZ48_03045, partial [Candidatus Bathyarchaeota archaeon]|nr:hypothetical protein [Candidatus Bathyarchaeota archaeon]